MLSTPLAINALQGKRIGISVSQSEDLARLGLLEMHFELALAEIARSVLVLGGGLAYGGHLRDGGYTNFLIGELGKYANSECTLDLCLRWHEHRTLTLSKLRAIEDTLGIYGEVICLDVDGNRIDCAHNRGEEAEAKLSEYEQEALTAMRRFMTSHTHGRVLLGGKRAGFSGVIPGLVEEALCVLNAQQALYLAGGFGGMCLDIVQAIEDLVAPTSTPIFPFLTNIQNADPRYTEGMRQLKEIIGSNGWAALNNGLTREENLQLATTHRPREIAAWVGTGLTNRMCQAGLAT